MPSVFFYVSGHGFGHASRQIEIINALQPRLPAGWQVVVRSIAAPRLFPRTIDGPFTLLPAEVDTGVIQHDSLRLDEEATADAARAFYEAFGERARTEAGLLHQHDARLVVCDAPPLACLAAHEARVPCFVVSNFTWDWIYEGYDATFALRAPRALQTIRDAYALASGALRMPLHGGFGTIPRVTDIPLVARRSGQPPGDVLQALGIPSAKPLVLSSFGGFGLEGFDLESLDCRDAWTVVITRWQAAEPPPPGVACVDEQQMYELGFRYEDLVAEMDAVVTKPGYGIVSECIAHDAAMLYTSRGHFVEYDVFVREMPRYLRCAFIEQSDLLAGRWRGALERLLASPQPPERLRTDGAEVAADALVRSLG